MVVNKAVGKKFKEEENILGKVGLAIICWFFGSLGVHRFIVGKIGTGILWLVTLGFCGIGTLVDFIMILTGNFTRKDGTKVTE